MVFDSFAAAIVGGAGVILGSITTIVASHLLASRKLHRTKKRKRLRTTPVFREVSSDLEFRILRALLGESEGRYLDGFQKRYYRATLDATIAKGWVEQIGSRYYLTSKGLEACESRLMQLLQQRHPEGEISVC